MHRLASGAESNLQSAAKCHIHIYWSVTGHARAKFCAQNLVQRIMIKGGVWKNTEVGLKSRLFLVFTATSMALVLPTGFWRAGFHPLQNIVPISACVLFDVAPNVASLLFTG